MTTGFVWHERYAWHDTGNAALFAPPGGWVQPLEHVESPESKRRFRNLLEISGLLDDLDRVDARPATRHELHRFHEEQYVDDVEQASAGGGGDAGELSPFGSGSYEIARLAAGGAIEAVDAVLDGEPDNAYALVRPPGHHAEAMMGRGFCIFNNVALAVMHARRERDVDTVAVVDLDVHHGNGTEQAFFSSSDVLTVSIHQDSFYPPGSGSVDDVGEGDGRGFNLNLPLPPGSGEGAYRYAMERLVVPAVEAFDPDLVVLAAGFDASGLDPMGRMMLHSRCYRELVGKLLDVAGDVCGGRFVAVHEGGYSEAYVPFAGHAVLEEMADVSTEVHDPFLPVLQQLGGQVLQPHQEDRVDGAVENLEIALDGV